MDAKVAPADIRYPTDLDLLNEARKKNEALIDMLYRPEPGKQKPRTYRRRAQEEYLSVAKLRKKTQRVLRRAIRKQLGYLRRNIKTIHRLLDDYEQMPLTYRQLRMFWIIQEFYRQQEQMYRKKAHRVGCRIVSLSQPHVRPIVRGKAGVDVEFGVQVSASYVNGYVFVDRLSWEAVHEGKDLKYQVERFRERFGFYPSAVLADGKYGSRENRAYLKEKGIKFLGRPLGRPPKEAKEHTKEIRQLLKQQRRQRVKIEGKFGQGKRGYDLNMVKAKTAETTASWIGVVFFVMNIAQFLKELIFSFFKLGVIALGEAPKWISEPFLEPNFC